MRYDAVLFDLDGTLTESAPGITACVKYALEQMGEPPLSEEKLLTFIGPPLIYSFQKQCGMDAARAEEAQAQYRVRFSEVGWKENSVYTGIPGLLRQLKDAGVYVALASAKPLHFCQNILSYFGLMPFFDKVIAPDQKNAHPDKAVLVREALPKHYTRACMVGDREYDMQGARAAGVDAIGALYGYGTRAELVESGADYIAETPEDLRRYLTDSESPRGLFISMEGSDGCGKSTQFALLEKWLRRCGYDVVVSREPGGCPISERIRDLVLDINAKAMVPECEALLYAASRAQHVREVIEPALAAGKLVLCDRYVDSSIVYQGAARGLGVEVVRRINELATGGLMPDATLFLDLTPEIALARRKAASALDRLEAAGDAFARRVYDAFLTLQKEHPERISSIDASGEIEQIAEEIRQTIMPKLCRIK